MMKKFGRVIFAGAILLVLLIWVVTKERGRVPEKEEVFKLRVEQCVGLQVKTDSSSYTLKKEGEQWVLVEPVRGWADKDAAERAIKAIAQLKPSGSRKDVNLDDEKWGLKKPALTAMLTYDGNRTVTVYFGKQTPDNSEYYVKIEGKNRLYFVPTYVYSDLTQSVDSLRDKALVHIERKDIKAVTLQFPDRVLSVEKRGTPEEPQWFLTQPYEAKADEWNAKTVAEKLVDLRAEGFAPEQPPAGKDYGFAKPRLKVTLTTVQGKQYVVTFGAKGREKIGPSSDSSSSSATEKDIVYARVEGRPEVLLIADTNMSDFQKTDMDLRDKHLLDVKKAQVRRIKVERKKGLSFTVERSGPDSWRLTAPVVAPANKTKVEDLLWDITELEAKEFLGEQKDLMKYGLAVADIVFTVTVEGRSEPIKIYVGYQKTDGVYYCRTSLSNQVYAIGELLVTGLPKSVDEIKEKPPSATSSSSTTSSSSSSGATSSGSK